MTKASIATIVQTMNDAGVKYLLVGGLAVNAHGYLRLTVDVDLILQFEPTNLLAGIRVLKALGYTPKIPVPIEDFADEAMRRSWREEKGAKVFALRSDVHPETDIDVFITDPLGFDAAYDRRISMEVAAGISATICAYDDLVTLKQSAGRPKDLLDLEQLRKARGES
ncbi:MAG TPA: hypothetical protein VM008_03875 [Phycisphaerae bacterium]|nr:hypothetical protein [Phycisphaerae bacterium]